MYVCMYLYLQGHILINMCVWSIGHASDMCIFVIIYYGCASDITQPNLNMSLKGTVANTCCSPLHLALPLIVATSPGTSSQKLPQAFFRCNLVFSRSPSCPTCGRLWNS